MAAPVTLVTARSESTRAGLVVSSLFVNEGDPGEANVVIGPLTDLWDVLGETGRCVVHIAEARHSALSDVFAGLRPNPGGVFARIESEPSEWGPVLVDLPNRAYCRVERMEERGWSEVVIAAVDWVQISDLDLPLIYYRGG